MVGKARSRQRSQLSAAFTRRRPAQENTIPRDTAVVWASEAADLIKTVDSAAALVARISAEAEARLQAGLALAR